MATPPPLSQTFGPATMSCLLVSALSSSQWVDHLLSESAFPMKFLHKPASSNMVFSDTDFHNASLPAAGSRVRPPCLSFRADILRTRATLDTHLTEAIFQTQSPPPHLPKKTDSADADSIMASSSETLSDTFIGQHGPEGSSLQCATSLLPQGVSVAIHLCMQHSGPLGGE